jgi:hypothetical protein
MMYLKKIFVFSLTTVITIFSCHSIYSKVKIDLHGSMLQNEPVINNYINYCAGCHGDNLEKFKDENWMFDNSPEDIAMIIEKGDEEMGMPAFRKTFTKKEIKELTKFILSAAKDPNLNIAPPPEISYDKNQTATSFWAQTIVTDLEIPWGMEFLPNGDMLIAERKGQLSRFSSEGKLTSIKGLPEIAVNGQGGLLDLQLQS